MCFLQGDIDPFINAVSRGPLSLPVSSHREDGRADEGDGLENR